MRPPSKASAFRRAASALVVVGLLVAVPAAGANAKAPPAFGQNPILFVHGIEGSGAQFESQEMRFMSNGYPAGWIDEVDYNSTRAVGDKSEVDQQIDDAIAALKQRTGKSKVDVVAHSLGTSVMYDYLTNGAMARAAAGNVGHYINVDGQDQNPGRADARGMGRQGHTRPQHGRRAERHDPEPDARADVHVGRVVRRVLQVPDRAPPAHDIVRQSGPIQLAGKALNFPQNSGAGGRDRPGLAGERQRAADERRTARVNRRSPTARRAAAPGARSRSSRASATSSRSCEPGLPTLHIYYEPFVRSDYTLRLLAVGRDRGSTRATARAAWRR